MSFNTDFNIGYEMCPICRNDIKDGCVECGMFNLQKTPCENSIHTNCDGHYIDPETNEECTLSGNACCSHYYHTHCIKRWLKIRPFCPLCKAPWMWSKDLSLSEKIVATWITSPEKILEYAIGDIDLGPKVDNFLLTNTPTFLKIGISMKKKKIIAQLFADTLDIDYLEKILAEKKNEIKRRENKTSDE